MGILAAVPMWLSNWMTPIWLLGVGALLAGLVLLVAWGVLFLVSRRTAWAAYESLVEGAMWPILLAIARHRAIFVARNGKNPAK